MTYSAINRRDAVKLAAGGVLAVVAGSCRSSEGPSASRGPDTVATLRDPMHYSSVRSLASAIRDGRVSSVEFVEACLARIDAVNPALNAVVQRRGGPTMRSRVVSRWDRSTACP